MPRKVITYDERKNEGILQHSNSTIVYIVS